MAPDAQPTLERCRPIDGTTPAAGSFVREFKTAPGPDPVPPAVPLESFAGLAGHPVAAQATCVEQIGGGPVHHAAVSQDLERLGWRSTLRHVTPHPRPAAHSAPITRAELRHPHASITPTPPKPTNWTLSTLETGSRFTLGPRRFILPVDIAIARMGNSKMDMKKSRYMRMAWTTGSTLLDSYLMAGGQANSAQMLISSIGHPSRLRASSMGGS
jgi:hypothetical protein